MKDQERPDSPPEVAEELFRAFSPDSPFAREVESLLSTGPAVVDEAELSAATDRLSARLLPQQARHKRPWLPIAAAASLLALAAAALLWVGLGPSESEQTHEAPEVALASPAPVPMAVQDSTEALELGAGTRAAMAGSTLQVASGVVAFRRHGSLQPQVDYVELTETGWALEPVGTVFMAGVQGQLAAVTVREGRVLVSSPGGALADLSAGEWLVQGPGGPVQFTDGAQPHLDPALGELVSELRWMSLPPATRAMLEQPASRAE